MKPSIVADPGALLKQTRRLLASDPEAALRQARQLLDQAPGDPTLLRIVGAAFRKLGKIDKAEAAEAEAIATSTQSPGHRQAAKALAAGDKAGANALLRQLLAEDETDVVALVMLGVQASTARESDTADLLLQKAVASAPADRSARLAYAEHLQKTRRSARALEQLDQLKPDAAQDAAVLSLRANALRDLGRIEEEIDLLRLLQQVDDPDRYHIRIGHALRALGRNEEAVQAYRASLAKYPHEGTAWWSLANLKTTRFSDDDIAAMQRNLDLDDLQPLNRIRLNFALGKAHEDRGDAERAFQYYAQGNRLRQDIATYDPQTVARVADRNIKLFTADFYAARTGAGCDAEDPIFIVGLQRSGSTLVEQILASHPSIEGTAELSDMPNVFRGVAEAAARRGVPIAQYLARLGGSELRALGKAYINSTRAHRVQGRPRFTDKMPNNWIHAHFIRLVLPNARIVDVRRHPLACCFSNWKQLYASGLEHSYSMEWMGGYYAEYVLLMRHLDTVQPGAVHRVIYERLVDDLEGEARRLLDYLDLPFDEAILDFHATDRKVRTISAGQVRQPINRKGIDQWRPFEPWLDPLRQALGPALEEWQQ